jgi:hypothetical protein
MGRLEASQLVSAAAELLACWWGEIATLFEVTEVFCGDCCDGNVEGEYGFLFSDTNVKTVKTKKTFCFKCVA